MWSHEQAETTSMFVARRYFPMPHSSFFFKKKISQPCSPHPGFPAEISKNATACYTKPKVNISSTKPLKSPPSPPLFATDTQAAQIEELRDFLPHNKKGHKTRELGTRNRHADTQGEALEHVS